MRRRQYSPYVSSYSFGPGPLSYAIKIIVIANLVCFVAQTAAQQLLSADPSTGADVLTAALGLRPAAVLGGRIWQPVTYMFLHAGVWHILFNMLGLWMFGTELERMWGTREFVKYYAVSGVGAGLLTVLISFLPFGFAEQLRGAIVIGASGAIYGVLLAYGLTFPTRPILFIVFPIPAKYCVMLMGALAFYYSLGASGGIASATHLGGLLVGYLYLKGGRIHPITEIKYRYVKWKINRARKKFDVYSGGRTNDWDRKVH